MITYYITIYYYNETIRNIKTQDHVFSGMFYNPKPIRFQNSSLIHIQLIPTICDWFRISTSASIPISNILIYIKQGSYDDFSSSVSAILEILLKK